MPSVAEELAALRRQSLAKNHAAKLQNANGLSTPEHEEQAIKTSNAQIRSAAYKEEAAKALNAGTKAVDQDLDLRMQQTATKKEEQKKRRESTMKNNAGTKAVDKHLDFERQKAAQKKEDQQKHKEAIQKNNAGTKSANLNYEGSKSNLIVEDQEKLKETAKAEVVDGEEKKVQETEAEKATNGISQLPEVEEVPDLPDVPELTADPSISMAAPLRRVQNRAEKKARKFMQKLGMRAIPGVSRVTLKLSGKQGYFTISQPDVFEKNGSYIMFGEAQQGSGMPRMEQQQAQAAQQLETPVTESVPAAPAEEQDEEVDESGVDPKDIDLVISQAGCTRAKAVTALKDNDGDLVNAIMSLTA